MSKLLNELRADTLSNFTENGCPTNRTTLNSVLDLFFIAGASRNLSEETIQSKLTQSFEEDKKLTLKLIFWSGDIRTGAGERRFFRIALNWLKTYHEDSFKENMHLIPHFNRWDSIFAFHSSDYVIQFVLDYLEQDALLAKWMPREGKSKNQEFLKAFLSYTGMSQKEYRKLVVSKSKTVEQQMSAKQFNSIKYEGVPSIAFSRYKKAFEKHDAERFSSFVEKVKSGKVKINASAIFPHQVYQSSKTTERGSVSMKAIDEQWNSLPNYLDGSNQSILTVCDTSMSMRGLPYEISVSLGMYFSERNNGIFKNSFITFSENPKLQYLQGSLSERINQFETINAANTDLQKVFELILTAAKKNKVPKKDMPTLLLIISDMEFDEGTGKFTAHQEIEQRFKKSGYKIPQIVYWNVNAHSSSNFPVRHDKKGVALVSGSSPVVIKSVLSGNLDPVNVMLKTLESSRYNVIK